MSQTVHFDRKGSNYNKPHSLIMAYQVLSLLNIHTTCWNSDINSVEELELLHGCGTKLTQD